MKEQKQEDVEEKGEVLEGASASIDPSAGTIDPHGGRSFQVRPYKTSQCSTPPQNPQGDKW